MARRLADRAGFFDARGLLNQYAVRRHADTPAIAAFRRRHAIP